MNSSDERTATSPERIDLEGTCNVRDIGGYRTSDGSNVRRGVFYRADNLGHLTPRGREQAIALGLDVIIDLRANDEVARFPNVFADQEDSDSGQRGHGDPARGNGGVAGRSPGPRYLRYDLIGEDEPVIARGDTIELKRVSERDETGAFRWPVERLVAGYTAILDDRREMVRGILGTLAEVNGRPMLYHCVAGQDRTGLVTALLLSIAGVDEETIAFDYGETAVFNFDRFRREGYAERWRLPIHSVEDYRRQLCPPEAMHGTLRHLTERYGGPVSYLRHVGVTDEEIDRLRIALV
ncbi:MAG: tyrosine-protein phosphatase [bacterium]